MKIKQIVCMYLNYSQEQYSKLHYDDLCVLICEKVIRFKTYPTDEYQKYYIIIQRLKISI